MGRNILKIFFTLFLGFFLGLTFGIIVGIFLGAIPALFFREIVNSHQSVIMSIVLTLLLGGLIGFSAALFSNKIFDANDNPLLGVLLGILAGLITVFFGEGVIHISDPNSFGKTMNLYPIIYGGRVGSEIGSRIFPLIGLIRVVRDLLAKDEETNNHENHWDQFQVLIDKHLTRKE